MNLGQQEFKVKGNEILNMRYQLSWPIMNYSYSSIGVLIHSLVQIESSSTAYNWSMKNIKVICL